MSAGVILLGITIGAPALVSFASLNPRARRTSQTIGVVGGAAAALAAVASAILVIGVGQQSTIRIDVTDSLWFGVTANRLTVLLLVLVTAVNAIVQIFARRQLHGDAAGPRFAVRGGFLISSTAIMVSAASVTTLAIGWTLAGLSLIAIVALYWPEAAARDAARHTTRMVIIGDAALWTGIALHLGFGGTEDMSSLAPAPDASPAISGIIACLFVIAAAARCSQMPFHRWLCASLAAPTPVSAILHAGVVNAGGILLVRFYPLVGGSWWATGLTFAIAAFGTVVAVMIMLTRPDAKGALVFSTIAQMAFLLLACSMGLLAAAISHLIAHGMFKSTLFLGSTSAVGSQVRAEDAPIAQPVSRTRSICLGALALLVAVTSVTAFAVILHPEDDATGFVLLAFAAVTAASAGWGWIRRFPTRRGVAVLIVVVPLTAACYLAILTAITHLLDTEVASAGAAAAPAWSFVAVLLALVAAWSIPTATKRFGPVRAWLYTQLLFIGQPISAMRRSTTAPSTLPTPVRRDTTGVRPVPAPSEPALIAEGAGL